MSCTHGCEIAAAALASLRYEDSGAVAALTSQPALDEARLDRQQYRVIEASWGEARLGSLPAQCVRRKAQAAGFDHHLTKPVDPDDIERLLAASLAASTALTKSAARSGSRSAAPVPSRAATNPPEKG